MPDLRLPVLVVAARKELTLQEIASLRDGASLEIGSGGEIPVELQVNNQVVATGRLVRVADKICASITGTSPLPPT
jgi:flagellar motor switch/type III secretory pathway protein FliN